MQLPVLGTTQAAIAAVVGYTVLVATVASIAVFHPDPLRRRDALEVLDRLTRFFPRGRS